MSSAQEQSHFKALWANSSYLGEEDLGRMEGLGGNLEEKVGQGV